MTQTPTYHGPTGIFTLDSHDTHGPFKDAAEAHTFAKERQLGPYTLIPWAKILVAREGRWLPPVTTH